MCTFGNIVIVTSNIVCRWQCVCASAITHRIPHTCIIVFIIGYQMNYLLNILCHVCGLSWVLFMQAAWDHKWRRFASDIFASQSFTYLPVENCIKICYFLMHFMVPRKHLHNSQLSTWKSRFIIGTKLAFYDVNIDTFLSECYSYNYYTQCRKKH